MRKELLEGLSDEQIEKVKACRNADELLALAKEEGVELSKEQLEAVSGGNRFVTTGRACPICNMAAIANSGRQPRLPPLLQRLQNDLPIELTSMRMPPDAAIAPAKPRVTNSGRLTSMPLELTGELMTLALETLGLSVASKKEGRPRLLNAIIAIQ